MRQRLARFGPVDYQVERHNSAWADHRLRTFVTASAIAWLQPGTVLDPACGDGSIVRNALRLAEKPFTYRLADISAPNIAQIAETTYLELAEVGDIKVVLDNASKTDVVVLTEILEHLSDPDSVLRLARVCGTYLVASSPVMRPAQVDGNPEHEWQFDRAGYEQMLQAGGWSVMQYTFLNFPATEYDFGIWVCR